MVVMVQAAVLERSAIAAMFASPATTDRSRAPAALAIFVAALYCFYITLPQVRRPLQHIVTGLLPWCAADVVSNTSSLGSHCATSQYQRHCIKGVVCPLSAPSPHLCTLFRSRPPTCFVSSIEDLQPHPLKTSNHHFLSPTPLPLRPKIDLPLPLRV